MKIKPTLVIKTYGNFCRGDCAFYDFLAGCKLFGDTKTCIDINNESYGDAIRHKRCKAAERDARFERAMKGTTERNLC